MSTPTPAPSVMTVRLGHYFSFIYLSPFSFPIYCTMDTLPSLLVMPCGLCPSPLLSITHLTLTPYCTTYACISTC